MNKAFLLHKIDFSYLSAVRLSVLWSKNVFACEGWASVVVNLVLRAIYLNAMTTF